MKESKKLNKAVCIERKTKGDCKYLKLNKIYLVNYFTSSLLEVYDGPYYKGVFSKEMFKKISKIREERIDSIL